MKEMEKQLQSEFSEKKDNLRNQVKLQESIRWQFHCSYCFLCVKIDVMLTCSSVTQRLSGYCNCDVPGLY